MTTNDYTDKQLDTYSYNDVRRFMYEGRISPEAFERYVHRWQAGAFRVTQLCQCDECRADYETWKD